MVVTTRLLTPLLGLLGCSSVLSAPLAAASKSGVSITRNNSFVAMGEASDIRLQRVNDGELLVSASAVTFDAPVDIADLWVRTAHGATVPLSDFVQVEPREAGTWRREITFGVRDICSEADMLAAGVRFVGESGYDELCGDDHYGFWCPNGCTGTAVFPLNYSTPGFARVKIGVSYDSTNNDCQGFLLHRDGQTGANTTLWTHPRGQPADAAEVTVAFNEGDELHVVETGTCVVDLYHLDIYEQNVGNRVSDLEARVAYLEQKLLNHSSAIDTLEQGCDWVLHHNFGSGAICTPTAMAAAGWTLTGINDYRCQTDNFGPWCGGTCNGAVSYTLPEGYSAARLVLGHSHGGSACRAVVTLYYDDGSQRSLFTHEAGVTFDPEQIEFQYYEGAVLEVVEVSTCIIDLYGLWLLPKTC